MRAIESVCSDEGVVEVDIWVGDLVEDVDGGGDVAAEGESGDELGSNVEVLVKMSFEKLGMDLLDEVEVGAAVEVAELLLQESPGREPCRNSHSSRDLHRFYTCNSIVSTLRPL